MRRLLPLLLVAGLTGCAGQDCGEDVDALRAERDSAREAYAELVSAGGATAAETTQADDAVHDLDARVFDAEQECAGR